MAEYTQITRSQYFDELGSRMEKLKKELENGPNPGIALQLQIASVGLKTAIQLLETEGLKPVYLKVNGFDSFEAMPESRYEHVKGGREFYSNSF